MSARDALLLEEPPGQLGVLGGHPHAVAEVGGRGRGVVVGHGQHDAHRPGRGLGVVQLPQRHHLAARLLDPVPAGDADVEEPLGDVAADLLGPKDADAVDARIVDSGLVVDVGRPPDGQVGVVEQGQGGLLQASPWGGRVAALAAPDLGSWTAGRPSRPPSPPPRSPCCPTCRRPAPGPARASRWSAPRRRPGRRCRAGRAPARLRTARRRGCGGRWRPGSPRRGRRRRRGHRRRPAAGRRAAARGHPGTDAG